MRLIGLTGVAVAALFADTPALAQTLGAGEIPKATAGQASRTTAYDAAFFTKYAPRTAYDIVQRIPGFTLDLGSNQNGNDVRGFAGTAGNVVTNGQRPSTKSEPLDAFLSRIPASRVKRVEVGAGALYGADYSSKTQVVNLILTEGGGGATGNVTIAGTRHFTGEIIPNTSATVSISRGPSTFNIAADSARGDQFEEGYDRVTDAVTGEQLEYRRKFNDIREHAPVVSASWALDKGATESANLNARYSYDHFFLHQRNHVIPTGTPEHDDRLVEDYPTKIFEIGGDVTRPLAGGAIKLVALANRRNRNTLDEYQTGDLGPTMVVGGFQQLTESQRNETIGRLTWSRKDVLGFQFEVGGEVAFNSLDYKLNLFTLKEGGGKTKTDLPIENATVREKRGEVWINAGRQLAKNLRIDLGLNYEMSHLTVSGDATADRKLTFPKPSITLDWQPGGGWHTQLILRRTVAQLDFYDFVSSAELSVGRVNGGNANLQPQRSWEGRLLFEHPIFKEGKVRLELGYDLVSLLQDRILVFDKQGKAFDAPGNLGTGRREYADLTIDAPLDRVWKGLRVKLHGNIQHTRVDDPISGDPRDWSGFFPRWLWDADIRRDVGKFAYGVSLFDNRRITFFRTDEFDSNFNAGFPYTNAFIEYRLTGKQTLTLNVNDISNTAGSRFRQFFSPNRTSGAPFANEYRFRNSHIRIGLTFKQSFGGGGVAK
ncbi:MAG: outer membrane beta-barrel protein [Sphingomicrobium sp.]